MKTIEEKIKVTREEVQEKGINFAKKYPFICLQYPTGLGKSYTCIKILENIYAQEENNDLKCLLLEPEIPLKDNIKKEFEKFNCEYLLSKIDIICYHSLHKIESNYYDIIVCDEAHHMFSEKRIDIFENQTPKYGILMSATIASRNLKKIEQLYNCNLFVHKISLKNAIEWGIIPKPSIGLFKLELNSIDRNAYYTFVRGKKENRKIIELDYENQKWKYIKDKKNYPNIELRIKATEQEVYNQLLYNAEKQKERYIEEQESAKKENREADEKIEKQYLYSELVIKRFLAERKTPYLEEFIKDAAKGRRLLCFCGSIAQAEDLNKRIPYLNVITSDKTQKQNQELIDAYNNKEINNLIAVGKLQEGMNLTETEVAIISQLDGSNRGVIQKLGRSLRLRNKTPEVYIFYYTNTKDENYLEKAKQFFDEELTVNLDYFTE